jgi:hypothetical protein
VALVLDSADASYLSTPSAPDARRLSPLRADPDPAPGGPIRRLVESLTREGHRDALASRFPALAT